MSFIDALFLWMMSVTSPAAPEMPEFPPAAQTAQTESNAHSTASDKVTSNQKASKFTSPWRRISNGF